MAVPSPKSTHVPPELLQQIPRRSCGIQTIPNGSSQNGEIPQRVDFLYEGGRLMELLDPLSTRRGSKRGLSLVSLPRPLEQETKMSGPERRTKGLAFG